MKKILITGIAGMLGSNIAYEMCKKYDIVGVDVVPVNMKGIKTYVFDMLEYNSLESCFLLEKPDIIVHTAAAVNVDKCELEPGYAERLNVTMTHNISMAATKIKAKVIYISTDAVFDGEDDRLYEESDIVHPINVYGKTKLKGEQIVAAQTDSLILRTNIYGFNIQDKTSFGEWVYTSLLNDVELNMFEDIDFSPILVNDLANIIDSAIQINLTGLYHACGTGSVSKYEFGCMIKETFGISKGKINKTTSDSFSFKAKRAKHMGMNNQKLCETLQCMIRTPRQSIEEFYRMYENGFSQTLKRFGGIGDGNSDWK